MGGSAQGDEGVKHRRACGEVVGVLDVNDLHRADGRPSQSRRRAAQHKKKREFGTGRSCAIKCARRG